MKRAIYPLVMLAVAVLLVLLVTNAVPLWNEFIRGTYWPASGKGYAFWSGPGSDIGELAIIATILGVARKVQCHQTRCWRIGRFRHGHLVLCHKHHPLVPDDGKVTAEHIDAVSKNQSG